jgi:hypothetical protein
LGPIKALMLSMIVNQEFVTLLVAFREADLLKPSNPMQEEQVIPVGDRYYRLSEVLLAL